MSATVTKKNPAADLIIDNVRIYLEIRSAFEQCDEEIKAAIIDMQDICRDPEATEEEKKRALWTIADALFPSLSVDFMSNCEEFRHSAEAIATSERMKAEEATFADRIQRLMEERSLTQEQLGSMIGVGQAAVCNMLSRQCRPQKRTISRLAEALGVSPDELWPGFSNR